MKYVGLQKAMNYIQKQFHSLVNNACSKETNVEV